VPGESTVFKMDGMMSGTQSWTGYTEVDGVWITAVMDYELRGDALAHMLDKVIIERVNARNLEDSLEALKRWVER
jgi:predicted metalloprotease with PDZ domain